MTNTLERQAPLKLTLPKAVAIVGCGGVGSWIAYFLALAGCESLWLFDPDTVSDHNLNRLPLPPSAIGKSKSSALAAMLTLHRPGADFAAFATFSPTIADTLKLYDEIDWLVCSTDTWSSRQAAHKWCLDHTIAYIEAGADGEFGSVSDAPATFAAPEESQPGYASVPVWVGPCTLAASIACAHILHNTPMPFDKTIRVGWEDSTITFFDSISRIVEAA
jgi:ThiF family